MQQTKHQETMIGIPRNRWLNAAVLLVITSLFVLLLCLLFFTRGHDREFRGKPESQWIESLEYNSSDQAEEWKSYGEEGMEVLCRGLNNSTRPGEKLYRQVHVSIPKIIRQWLPAPRRDSNSETRQIIVSLIRNLGTSSKAAIPIMIQVALDDENSSVRQGALGYFIGNGGSTAVLGQLNEKQKKVLLPAFSSVFQNPKDQNLRHNASIGMKFFKSESKAITPILRKALKDSDPYVQLYSADALNQLNPSAGLELGATSLLIEFAKGADLQLAAKAVSLLANPGVEAELAVPALVEFLQESQTGLLAESCWALDRAPKEFYQHADKVLPALKIASQNERFGGYARNTLSRWNKQLLEIEQ